jgi:hypothetical protein
MALRFAPNNTHDAGAWMRLAWATLHKLKIPGRGFRGDDSKDSFSQYEVICHSYRRRALVDSATTAQARGVWPRDVAKNLGACMRTLHRRIPATSRLACSIFHFL